MIPRILVLYSYNNFEQTWLMEVLATPPLVRYSGSLIFSKANNIFPVKKNVAHNPYSKFCNPAAPYVKGLN